MTEYDYSHLTLLERRQTLAQQIKGLEQVHWVRVLDKIANPGNVAAHQTIDEELRRSELGIAALRRKLAELDAEAGVEAG